MDFMTVKEASALWNMDISTIGKLLRAGKIPRATKIGGHWVIPTDTPRVLDGRTKAAKAEAKEDFFRFPLYVNREEDSFAPPLSAEEKALRQAELDFLACDFRKAEKKLTKLSEDAENIYVRTMAHFWLCWLSAVNHNGNGYNRYFLNLEQALAKDFPHKREMALLRPWLYMDFAQYEKASDCLDFDANYEYSPSVYPLMSYLLYIDKSGVEQPEAIAARANLYEITVRQLTNSGDMFEAQLLHLALFIFYYVKADEKTARGHLKSAVEIAYQYHFIYSAADAYPYYKAVFHDVLSDYPPEFADKVKQCGLKIDKSFSAFSKKNHVSDIFYLLSNSDMKFVLYAAQGYSYKQIAEILHVSGRTIANRYAEIYGKLGVDGKQSLLDMIQNKTADE